MEIKRDIYLNRLIGKKNNELIKVVTGIRRCGKSYLLFSLFNDYLLANSGPKDVKVHKPAFTGYIQEWA